MVPDHKQKDLKMRYWELQVDYFGKKGTILLGIMEIRWKFDGEVIVFEYLFVDYVNQGILWPVSCAGCICNSVSC